MAKKNPYLKLIYMYWNFYRKFFNILLQNLMRMEHFEIYLFKLIKKIKYTAFWYTAKDPRRDMTKMLKRL